MSYRFEIRIELEHRDSPQDRLLRLDSAFGEKVDGKWQAKEPGADVSVSSAVVKVPGANVHGNPWPTEIEKFLLEFFSPSELSRMGIDSGKFEYDDVNFSYFLSGCIFSEVKKLDHAFLESENSFRDAVRDRFGASVAARIFCRALEEPELGGQHGFEGIIV
jgi:hypothetical protein